MFKLTRHTQSCFTILRLLKAATFRPVPDSQFSEFTLTLLTPSTRPPAATTPAPPIARLSRTDHASAFTPLVKVSHTFVFHWWRVATRQTVVNFVFLFSGACFTQLLVKANWIPVWVASLNGRSSSVSLFCSTFHLVIFHTFWADVNTSVFKHGGIMWGKIGIFNYTIFVLCHIRYFIIFKWAAYNSLTLAGYSNCA